jgi:hypothetical protein
LINYEKQIALAKRLKMSERRTDGTKDNMLNTIGFGSHDHKAADSINKFHANQKDFDTTLSEW